MNSFGNAIFAAALALAGAGAGLGATSAAAHEPKQTIMTENTEALAFQEAVGYSNAVIANGMIYLSGVVAVPREGEESMAPAFTPARSRRWAIR